MRFFVPIIGLATMILILKYRAAIRNFTGEIAFAERYLGSGGTNTLVVLIGIGCFIMSLFYATGSFQNFIVGTFGGFFGK